MPKSFKAIDYFKIVSERWPFTFIQLPKAFGKIDTFRMVNESRPLAIIQMSRVFGTKAHYGSVIMNRSLATLFEVIRRHICLKYFFERIWKRKLAKNTQFLNQHF